MSNVTSVSYTDLYECLSSNDTNKINKNKIYFLLTENISFCANTDNCITNKINENNKFFIFKDNDSTLYIDSIIINDLKNKIENAISDYIRENGKHNDKITSFLRDKEMINFFTPDENKVLIKDINKLSDFSNILNKLYHYTKSSVLLNKLINDNNKEVSLFFSKKDKLISSILNLASSISDKINVEFINNKIINFFNKKNITEIIDSVDNKKDIFPNGIISLNSQFSILNLKASLSFNEENNNIKPKELPNNKVLDEKILKKINRINEIKHEVESYIPIFNEIFKIYNENLGYLYYSDFFECDKKYIKNSNNIIDFFKSSLFELSESSETGRKYKIEILAIVLKQHNEAVGILNEKNDNNDINGKKEKYNKFFTETKKLEDKFKEFLNNINEIEKQKNNLSEYNVNFRIYIDRIKLNCKFFLKIKDTIELKNKLNDLSKVIENKI
ncbi:hypothetical protein M997_3072 [Proteus hauseri ATCC 700826]|uniref:Uncharacterized protein n=1 Tax=Proteus hauseri ATCC 700826 TaxID=1354271 RepID=A0AAJ3HQ96_PROHU|nr:hypothetical protein [Proteus hauseri]OAT45326.1 hypothetical protein M997_3072 [Proteus hauseri ATCC 700826]